MNKALSREGRFEVNLLQENYIVEYSSQPEVMEWRIVVFLQVMPAFKSGLGISIKIFQLMRSLLFQRLMEYVKSILQIAGYVMISWNKITAGYLLNKTRCDWYVKQGEIIIFNQFPPTKVRMWLVRRGLQWVNAREKTGYR